MRSRRRFWRSERGQTTAMIVSMLMVFILFVAMVVNTGQAVNRRVALQIVADAGAFTGATVMAAGMNHLAYWNRQIQRIWAFLSVISLSFSLGECVSNWTTVGNYYAAQAAFQGAYWTFAAVLGDRPRRVSEYNVADLFPGEVGTFDYAEFDSDPLILPGRIPGTFVPVWYVDDGAEPNYDSHDWAVETPYDLLPVFTSFSDLEDSWSLKSWTCGGCCWYVSTVYFYVVPWYKHVRLLGRPTYFAWRVRAPATKALMFDWFFGPNAIPEMKAVAVAKPVGGDIEEGESNYIAKMMRLIDTAIPWGFITDSRYDRGVRPLTH